MDSNMTGRELILYILQNNLENAPIVSGGRFLCFLTVNEAAVRFGVGESTIRAWVHLNQLEHIQIGDVLYIPKDAVDPRSQNGQEIGKAKEIKS